MDKYALQLHTKLNSLSYQDKLLFAFWISKRLFHNYVHFNEKTSFGDIDIMLDSFNLIEYHIKQDNALRINEINDIISKIEENTPDTNDYSTILASFALDACNALNECLRYILDKDVKHVVDIGIFARDTVDMFIQELEDMDYNNPNFELNILNNELMKKEMARQKLFLKRLKNKKVTLEEIVFDKIIEPSLV